MCFPGRLKRAFAGTLRALGMRLMTISMPPFISGRSVLSGRRMAAAARKLRLYGYSMLNSASADTWLTLAGLHLDGAPRSTRGSRPNHAVELPADDGSVEDRPGACGRQ